MEGEREGGKENGGRVCEKYEWGKSGGVFKEIYRIY